MTEQFAITGPQINRRVPELNPPTTHGQKSLDDDKGKWLILFSHPADLTPVCTTEFIGFARRQNAFRDMGVEQIGLSTDSVHSLIAWGRNIKEKWGVEIKFPIIADLNMKVANAYGLIRPGGAEARMADAGEGVEVTDWYFATKAI